MTFENRRVVVTGGTGALGSAVVAQLLEAGARVVVPYRGAGAAQRFAHREHRNTTLVEIGSLAEESAIDALYAGIDDLWASIHVAGAYAMASIAATDKAALMSQLETNLVSAFLCSRAAITAFGRAGHGGGRIVNVVARQALEPRAGANATAYTAAKAGLAAVTIALAEEVAKDGILVNAVAPSIMDTSSNREAMPKADFDRWPKAEEVAATIVFLASPENRVTRGSIVPVYGKS